MSVELNRVVSAFGGAIETRGDKVKIRCPECGHHSLWVEPGDKLPVIGWCELCQTAGKQEQVTAAVLKAAGSNGATRKESMSSVKKKDDKKEAPISPPWEQWVPLTEATYQIVKQARNARKSYMPRLETLRKLGVREAPGRLGSPHAQVGFPFSLGDEADEDFAMALNGFATTRQKIDNLKVLTDVGFNGGKAKYYQAGPKSQDVVFGNQDTFLCDEIWLVEGQWDAACLIEHGYSAWAILASGQKELHPGLWTILSQAQRIPVVRDREKDGSNTKSFAKLLPTLPSFHTVVELPEGFKDICELRHRTTESNFRSILSAVSAVSITVKLRSLEKETVVEDAPDLLIADIPESVLDGRLGEICKERMTGLPLAYSWLALVTAAGVLVKPTKSIPRTSLFAGLVGPVNSGKSASIDKAISLLDIRPPLLYPKKTGSAEGMLKDIGNANGQARLWSPDELIHPLEKAKIQNASFASTLNSLYYKDRQDLTIGKGEKVEFNARLSLIGGIPDDKFQDGFGPATTGGLYDRFLFGLCPTGFKCLFRADEGEPVVRAFDYSESSEETDGFLDSLAESKTNRPIEVPFNPDVYDWRDSLANDNDINTRVLEHAIRMAAICAAFDGRSELCAADLGPAEAQARYQTHTRLLLAPNTGKNQPAECEGRIRRALNRHASDGRWVEIRWLDRTTSAGRDFGSGIFLACLRNLEYNGEIQTNLKAKPRLVRLVPGQCKA